MSSALRPGFCAPTPGELVAQDGVGVVRPDQGQHVELLARLRPQRPAACTCRCRRPAARSPCGRGRRPPPRWRAGCRAPMAPPESCSQSCGGAPCVAAKKPRPVVTDSSVDDGAFRQERAEHCAAMAARIDAPLGQARPRRAICLDRLRARRRAPRRGASSASILVLGRLRQKLDVAAIRRSAGSACPG